MTPPRLLLVGLLVPALAGCGFVVTETSSAGAEAPDVSIETAGAAAEPGASSEQAASGEQAVAGADIDRVVMIGDSITKGARPYLEERFEELGLDHVIEAEQGKRMVSSSQANPSGASIASSLIDEAALDGERPDGGDGVAELWVVALGTNDIGQYASDDEIAAAVDEVLAEVPADVVLVWVDTWIRDRIDQTRAVNDVIEQRLERRGNAVVARWSAVAEDDGVLTGDGVHPTPTGAEVFAAVVADTVESLLAP